MVTGFNVGNFSGGNPLEIRSDNLGGRRSGPRGRGDRVYGRCGRSIAEKSHDNGRWLIQKRFESNMEYSRRYRTHRRNSLDS